MVYRIKKIEQALIDKKGCVRRAEQSSSCSICVNDQTLPMQ